MSTTIKTFVVLALVATVAACQKKAEEAPAADAAPMAAEQPMGKY